MSEENDTERPSARELAMGQILNILPEGREYKLEDWNLYDRPMVSDDLQFEVSGRMNIRTKEETLLFSGGSLQQHRHKFQHMYNRQTRQGKQKVCYECTSQPRKVKKASETRTPKKMPSSDNLSP